MSDRLRRSISGLLDSGRYFDAKIECGGETFHVHKSVVCTQSEYFARVFDENNGFKEGQTSSIELKDIEASTVRAMIEFMYHGDYKTTEENEIMLNIDVYATAEMYQVEGLKDIAAQHFKVVVPSFFDLPTFPDAIRAIYQGTMEEDRGLRDVLVETAAGKIDELIKDPVFNAVLEEVGAFGKHLIHTIHGRWKTEERLRIQCPNYSGRDAWGSYRGSCGRVMAISPSMIQQDWFVKCDSCKKSYRLTEWQRA
ncbi:BTB/POZ protein [Phyllosticta capitalensis]